MPLYRKSFNTSNDGSGSGLDADKLDGSELSAITHSGDSVALTGDVTGSTTVAADGSISITTTVADNSHDHTRLIAVDDRDMKPNTSLISGNVKGVKAFFSSLGGMTSTANTDYQDVLVLDTYSDASGGNPNAITFDKSEIAVRLWQGAFDGTTWGTSQRVFADNYHPNADKWTTARTHTVTLTGDVTGTAGVSVDGSGDWTNTITTTVADNSHNHNSSSGDFTVNGKLFVDQINCRTDQDLTITTGEADSVMSETSFNDEIIRLAGENGVKVYASSDNLTSGLNRETTLIDPSGNMIVGGDLTVSGGNISITNNNGGIDFNDANSYWLRTATNWGVYWDTTNNTFELHGAGTDRWNCDLDNGNTVQAGDAYINGGNVFTGTSQQRVKLSVWNSTTYGIGMGAGYTFGGINNEYVMSFQMSDTAARGFWWGDSGHSNAQGAMALTTTGLLTLANGARIGFGESDTTTPTAGVVEINGLLTATTKSFTIDHPTKEGHKLRYGSLEGPENGVYVRGRLQGSNVIELPEYWPELVHEDSITVQLTANGSFQKLYVKDIKDNKVVIGNGSWFSNNTDCFYVVYGERKDVDKLEVEFEA